jgi:L-asparaginase II
MSAEILVNVIRGDTVESVHRGHLVVMDGEKNILASAGDPGTVTYVRSAAKAFQAIPTIVSGAADRFAYGAEEIALACASHSGEPRHIAVVKRMLEKAGLNESDLKCGSHMPFDTAAAAELSRSGRKPTSIHNNCSGKHSAMLAFAKHIGADISSYDSPENPVQKAILKNVAMFAEVAVDDVRLGTDGCAAPNFAIPVTAMARMFANLINPPTWFDDKRRDACARVISAMTAQPELIGGRERLDTMLMNAARGKLISKVGAEGVWLCGVLPNERYPSGLAIALKIEDGDDKRARPVVAVDLLRKLEVLSSEQLVDTAPMPILNRRGENVGRVVATIEI